MIISGLQKTTLLDYPGHVAATIFIGGCNFRCPFCHNMDIVENIEGPENKSTEGVIKSEYSKEDILIFLTKRAGVLDGVCITGGEPTLNKDLKELISSIKKIKKTDGKSLLIKLDTNGTNPKIIEELIDEKFIDYVAMDIKTSVDEYPRVAGLCDEKEKSEHENGRIKANNTCINGDITDNIKRSVSILINSNIEYEFRTTIVSQYHNNEVMQSIGELIKGAKKYYLQSFSDSKYVKDHSLSAVDKERLEEYRLIMSKYVDEAFIRGVD